MSTNKDKFTPCLKKKYSTDKYGIINIRFTQNRKSQYFSTKIRIHEKYWNPTKHQVRENHKESDKYNNLISNRKKELERELGSVKDIDKVKEREKLSFVKYLLNEIDHLEQRKRIGTSKRYKTSYYHLEGYLKSIGKSDLLFSDIDVLFVRDFETYILGQNIKNNTSKNYINCIKRLYNQSVRMNIFIPSTNPFILYVNRKEQVQKKRLSKLEFEKIINTTIVKGDPLFNTRNYFLFQVMSQGLRVGDLLTMRFSNIIEGRLKFFQWKTKKPHSILINDNMMMILKEYIDVDTTEIFKTKWGFKVDNERFSMTYDEMKAKYKEITKKSINGTLMTKGIPQEVIKWKSHLDSVRFKVFGQLVIKLHQFSKKHPTDFIFPILRNEDFKDVSFLSDTTLTKYQYNQISSKTSYYNKTLKKLQSHCEISTNLSSHISRHTFTDFMLMESIDVYDISKSLGHSKLSTTEHYLKEFSQNRVDDSTSKVNGLFSI